MTHTRVVHCKKWKDGKWTKPFFSKHVKVQCGKRQKVVRSGTQIIDGIWRLLRKGKWGGHGSEQDLEAAIRWVQWKYSRVPGPRSISLSGQHLQDQLLIGVGAWHLG